MENYPLGWISGKKWGASEKGLRKMADCGAPAYWSRCFFSNACREIHSPRFPSSFSVLSSIWTGSIVFHTQQLS